MTIGMPQVHLARIPRHVRGGENHLQSRRHALLVDLVYIVHPDRHPNTLVCGFVTVWSEGGGVGASSAAALTASTQEDSTCAAVHAAECGRCSPFPHLFPSPFFKPG